MSRPATRVTWTSRQRVRRIDLRDSRGFARASELTPLPDDDTYCLAPGFFSGTYNAVVGKVNGPKGVVGDVSGLWSDSMEFKDAKVRPLIVAPVG